MASARRSQHQVVVAKYLPDPETPPERTGLCFVAVLSDSHFS
jgi:hypothetical protein